MGRTIRRGGALLVLVSLLFTLTVGGALAAPDKAPGKGPKKGRPAHVVGTVAVDSEGKTVAVTPRNPKKGRDPVVFTIVIGAVEGNTRFVGEGVAEGTAPALKAGMRVNIVGRKSTDGKSNIARVIVIQGPEDDRDSDAVDKGSRGQGQGSNGQGKGKNKDKD